MAVVLNLPGPREVEKPKGSLGEDFPDLDLPSATVVHSSTANEEVKSPTVSVNLSAALGAASAPAPLASFRASAGSTRATEPMPAPPARKRLTVTVEEHVPERVHLRLPKPVQHRWQQRVSAAHRERRPGVCRSAPPLRWYSQHLLELCGPVALHLAPKLHQLEEHQQSRPWIWKDGGRLPVMLEQCSIMLSEASQVAEDATMHLCTLPHIRPTLLAVREKCFRPPHVEPTLHACLECSTAEEAMALATVELSRLQGSGSAIGCALRSCSSQSMVELKATFEEEQWEDFVKLVPFLEMTLSKLEILVDRVFQQLEEDFLIAPPDVDTDNPFDREQTMVSNLEPSESITALWAAQVADPANDASDHEDSPAFGHQISDVPSDGEPSPKTRKKGKKKTLTNSPKSTKNKK